MKGFDPPYENLGENYKQFVRNLKYSYIMNGIFKAKIKKNFLNFQIQFLFQLIAYLEDKILLLPLSMDDNK